MFNPVAPKLDRLYRNIRSAEERLGSLELAILKHSATDIEALKERINVAIQDVQDLNDELRQTDQAVSDAVQELKEYQDKRSSLEAVVFYFSKWKKLDRDNIKVMKDGIGKLKSKRSRIDRSLSLKTRSIAEMQEQEKEYLSVKKDELRKEYRSLRNSTEKMKSEAIERLKLKEKIDEAIRPLVTEVQTLERRKEQLDKRVLQAECFEDDLSLSRNSYEKRMVHKRCEDLLGESSPRSIISGTKKQLGRVERDIRKLSDRISHIVENEVREVDQLVIDGNNLCYSEGKYIGIAPVRKLVEELSPSYKITVVFDSGIRGLSSMGDKEIREKIGNGVAVHVVASTQAADETLLDLSGGRTTYVISNDRFVDFPEKCAVREDRVLRHEVVGGMVMVSSLGVRAVFEHARTN